MQDSNNRAPISERYAKFLCLFFGSHAEACRAVYYGAILNSVTRLMMHDMHLLFYPLNSGGNPQGLTISPSCSSRFAVVAEVHLIGEGRVQNGALARDDRQ